MSDFLSETARRPQGQPPIRSTFPSSGSIMGKSFDVLSEVLRGARLRSWGAEEKWFTEPWSVTVSPGLGWFCYVLRGECFLDIHGAPSAVLLAAGDLVVAMQPNGHRLNGLANTPIVVGRGNGTPSEQPIRMNGGQSPTRFVWGRFLFDDQGFWASLASLPPLMHVKDKDGKTRLSELLELMMDESDLHQAGRHAIVEHLTQILLIYAIRSYLTSQPARTCGWLAAVGDPDIGPVLGLMRTQPERPWTVAALAEQACLSRSVFASRFKSLVSKSPLQYLLDCRMEKACTLLREGQCGIKEIAAQVGYATESAFSKAFKQWSGASPREFAREAIARDCLAGQQGEAR